MKPIVYLLSFLTLTLIYACSDDNQPEEEKVVCEDGVVYLDNALVRGIYVEDSETSLPVIKVESCLLLNENSGYDMTKSINPNVSFEEARVILPKEYTGKIGSTLIIAGLIKADYNKGLISYWRLIRTVDLPINQSKSVQECATDSNITPNSLYLTPL